MGTHGDQVLPVEHASLSYWRTELSPLDSTRSTPQLPSQCDIAIIGAGMSGVSVAYHILEAYGDGSKPSITILDAREVCSGATGRNGTVLDFYGRTVDDEQGHIKAPTPGVMALKRRHGLAAAEEIAAFMNAHIYALKAVVEKESLNCEFELRRSFDVFLDGDEGEEVKKNFQSSLKAGEEWTRNVSLVPEEHVPEITSIHNAKTAFSVPACSLWPYKFVTQLLERILEHINLQTHTPVTAVQSDPTTGQQALQTPRGQLLAHKVIFATNAYTSGILPQTQHKITPTRVHCSHLTRDPAFHAPHLSHTYNITYGPQQGTDYLNPRPNGSIVVGGAKWTYEGERARWWDVWDDSEVLEAPAPHFGGLMQQHFRGWEASGARVAELWSGITGTTADGLPFVGNVPGAEGRQYIIAGFNGGGMPVIFLSARGLAKMVKDGVSFAETGVPKLYEATQARLQA